MDNQRLFLIIALSFIGLLLFQAWQEDYSGAGAPARQAAAPAADPQTTSTAPEAEVPAAAPGDVPVVPRAAPAQTTDAAQGPTIDGSGNRLPSSGRVRVTTDVLDVVLDTTGGDVRQVDLRTYAQSIEDPTPFRLMTDRGARLYVAQSGLSAVEGEAPDHTVQYQAERNAYTLAPDQDKLTVKLHWQGGDGLKVTKTYTFFRGSFAVDVRHEVENAGASAWRGSAYRQLQRTHVGEETQSMFIYTYMGGAIYTPEDHYDKVEFSDMQEEDLALAGVNGGWIAMLQHYFVSAWAPPADATNQFYTRYRNNRYYIGMITPAVEVAGGGAHTFNSTLYLGPKLPDQLEELATGLELTVDYGLLTVIAKPLFWLLKKFHDLTGNWGWAIILLTVLIKLVFYKLSETSYRSMAKMRKVQPRMQALKERHGDDKQKLNQSLMELYKREKINPLGGCLPILVQIPVFIALYWVLLESVQLRHAPWILWIEDLSIKDPFFVLPVLMGITMFLQQKLNPAPLDPVQAKIMMFLPLVFTIFFAFFPAGLVLYWLVNNALSILQQWVITRRVTADPRA